jgi:hypothetical protein
VDVARRIANKVECMVMDRENVTPIEEGEEWYWNLIVFVGG